MVNTDNKAAGVLREERSGSALLSAWRAYG